MGYADEREKGFSIEELRLRKTIKPGDWVMSCSPGIWQVYRVLRYKLRDPAMGVDTEETTVFSKRFISKSGKVSFGEECCALSLVASLSEEVLREIRDFITENRESFERFAKYNPKEIDMVYNARMSLPGGMKTEELERSIPKEELLRDFEIEELLKRLGVWDISGFQTAQFVSPNFTCRDGYLVYTFNRILTFGIKQP